MLLLAHSPWLVCGRADRLAVRSITFPFGVASRCSVRPLFVAMGGSCIRALGHGRDAGATSRTLSSNCRRRHPSCFAPSRRWPADHSKVDPLGHRGA
jgi:hypothetical protein